MPDLTLEQEALAGGAERVAGIDEAGRGPLAGPVIAAAVVLPPDFLCPRLDDSKKLSEKVREALYFELMEAPGVAWGVASTSPEEIDELNIFQATTQAMRRAVEGLVPAADFALIDGRALQGFPLAHRGVVKGDSLSLSIAAASVIAKVSRDRVMVDADKRFPGYGFAKHKGYGTAEHLEALRRLGPCPLHRQTFAPVAHASRSRRVHPG
ncbi:MAG: ribonuclease HII [Verrucomicrobiota bacterium]